MFLAVDIGNSAVKCALFDGDDVVRTFSVFPPGDSPDPAPAEHWLEELAPHLDNVDIDQIGLVSVVPARTTPVTEALERRTDAPITALKSDASIPFALSYDTPETLGVDRLAAAAAGWVSYGRDAGRSVIVVDAGTAVNYEVVRRDGTYLGGAIAPGPALARESLRRGTAQLPEVSLDLPDTPVGRSTQSGLRSGIMWGLVDSVQGMVRRGAQDLPDTPVLVLTGGWSQLLADHLDHDHRSPLLVLRGVRILTLINRD